MPTDIINFVPAGWRCNMSPISDKQLELYGRYIVKLAALKAENAKHDFSADGNNRYHQALVECKQAYRVLADEEQRLYDAGQRSVFV